ncbi:hypothetical protein BASA84_000045 [Batrachochytrium salamandrivorans]|nr:hypothetical protein BASA84_000045 [Batrachochytrium salamandrivorans]
MTYTLYLSWILQNHQVWVSSDSKQSHYNGKANPYPDLDNFRKTYGGMTDEQFNFGLTTIFNKMRDMHTLYYKAGPYGCFSVSTGLLFKLVDDSSESSAPPKVRVVGITNTPEVLSLIGRSLSRISVGDELLTINGVSFDDWYNQNKFILGFGANDSGGQRGAFQYLEGVLGRSNILPDVDDITFQLKRVGGSQSVYTVTVPYVTLYNDECWSLFSKLYKELTGIALPEMPASKSFRYKRSALGNGASLSGNSTLQRRDTSISKRSYWESGQFEDANIDGWSWTIWKSKGKNMGVIKIESFAPILRGTGEETSFMFLISIMRDLLIKQLKDTDAILFDVRGNPGGLISGADGIIQLLKPDATASQFRYLKNEVTKDLFYKGPTSKNPWSKAWRETSDSSRYSGLESLYESSVSNTFGQVYFNPVGVYTDGVCYSACEIFAAHIQDRGIGTIFGDDETTDPFTKKLTGKTSGHKFYTKISVGSRQLVRGGNYAGQLVEDDGVKADVIVRSTVADILPGRGVSTYDRIANYLDDVAKKQVDSNVYFGYEPYSQFTFEDSIDITVVASGVDEIIVVSRGETLGKWEGKVSTSRQDCKITIKIPAGLKDHLITFIGKKQGRQMFKTYREFTRTPTSNDRINMKTTNSYTVSGPSSSVGVYSFAPTPKKDGWNFSNGKWILGDGISDYSGYMYSTVRVWLTAPVGTRISVSIDATVDTDNDGGYFSLDMTNDSGEVFPMLSSTSEDGLTQYQSITGRNRVIKETHSFTITTENFALSMKFISYIMESPFSVKVNSIVITKN